MNVRESRNEMGTEVQRTKNNDDVEMESALSKKPSLPLSQPLLDLFWDLAELNQSKQIEATTKLISELHKEIGDGSFNQKSEQAGDEDSPDARSLEYTLARLVRGLGSNRKGVRWGFGAALTVLLQEFPSLKTSKVLLEMEQSLKITSSHDMKTMAVGQLTVIMALINSGRLHSMNGSHIRTILDILLKLEKERSYLRAAVHEILNQIVQKISAESFERSVLPQLRGHLGRKITELDLDGLMLLLQAAQFHKDAVKSVFKQSLGTADLLDQKNIEAICKLLFTTSTRFLHPSVVAFAKAFHARPATFPLFWAHFIDVSIAESTPWKAKIPFEIAPSLLKTTTGITDSKQILPIVTTKFLNAMLRNAVTDRKNETEGLKALHASASHAVKEVQNALKLTRDQECIYKVLTSLLADKSVLYNKVWSTFVSTLLYRVDAALAAKASETLVGLVKTVTGEKNQIMTVLENVLKDKVKTPEDVKKFSKLIRFFGEEVFTAPQNEASISSKALMKFLSASSLDQLHRKAPVINMEEVEKEIAMKLAVMKALASSSAETNGVDHDEQTSSKRQKTADLSDKSTSLTKQLGKLELGTVIKTALELLIMTVSALWLKVKPALGEEMLKELSTLVKDLKKEGGDLTEEKAAGRILTLLLSLLAVERSMFRTVELVFKALSPFLNEEALNELFALVESESEEMGDDEGEPIEFESEDEEGEEDDEWSDVEEEENVEEGADLASEMATLKQFPGVAKMPVDGQEEVASEPDLDDEAMFQLDEVFANIMKARKNAKDGGGSDEADVKMRALKLIMSWFASTQTDDVLVLRFVAVLMKLANDKVKHSERQKQGLLADSCGKILQLTKYRRKIDAEKVRKSTTAEEVMAQMAVLIEETGKVQSLKLHQQCTESLLFAQRLLSVFLANFSSQEVASTLRFFYLPKLQSFAGKRTCTFGHILWSHLLNNLPDNGTALLPDLNEIIFSDELVTKKARDDEEEEEGDEKKTDGTKLSRKYLPIRQVQLCEVAKNVVRGKGRTAINENDTNGMFSSAGKLLTATLTRTLNSEGPVRVKKLLEEVCGYGRFLLKWHVSIIQVKNAANEKSIELWDMKELARLMDALIKDKLNTKAAKSTRKVLLTFRQKLGGCVDWKEGGDDEKGKAEGESKKDKKKDKKNKKMKSDEVVENGMDTAE